MVLEAGDVLYIHCSYITPPHFKYVICICPNWPLFFFINTEPRRITPDAQLRITPAELPFLDRDSYVDTAQALTFSKNEIAKSETKGSLPENIKRRIREITDNHKHLPLVHKKLVDSNLI